MWRSKKLIIIEVLILITLLATVGLITVAYANNGNTNQNNTTSLMEKVAEIYKANTGTAIDPQQLENAFTQARQEMRSETLDEYLQKLVEEGKITQEQADEFKAWLDARPDLPTQEFREWLNSRPDIPNLFGQHNRGGMMFYVGRHDGEEGVTRFFSLCSHDCWPD